MTDIDDQPGNRDLAAYLSRVEAPMKGPYRRPRDSATLILLDGPPSAPSVLLGKRSARHAFLPGKFVFPGGAVDTTDSRMPAANKLDAECERRLLYRTQRPSRRRARAIALAAIRETAEETGLLIGLAGDGASSAPAPAWSPFADARLQPNLGALTFVARAITPPGRPRRFDTRFFVAHRRDIGGEVPGVIGPESELVELRWLPFDEARRIDMPTITKIVLAEIETRLRAGFSRRAPVPFYYFRHGRANRDEIS
jgi:8-oxo-dGTP pyrophosphatase MutT (NUDIX family)